MVDSEFVLLFDLYKEFSQLRVVQWFGGLMNECSRCLLNLLLVRRRCAELLLGPFLVPIRIERLHKTTTKVFEREAPAGFADGLFIFPGNPVLHAGQPSGDAGQHVFFCVPQGHGLEQLLKGNAGLLLHRSRVGLVLLADADGIDNDEVVFACGVGRDGLEIIRLDDADAPALHLLEEGA